MRLRNLTPGESTVHAVAHASCSCGWSCSRISEAEVRACAQTHALGHRVRGLAVVLPLMPIAGARAWSSEETAR